MIMNKTEFPFAYAAILLLLIFLCLIINSCQSINLYNDGICSICGGHYEYSNAVGHKYITNYIYICDKCGRSIEVDRKY